MRDGRKGLCYRAPRCSLALYGRPATAFLIGLLACIVHGDGMAKAAAPREPPREAAISKPRSTRSERRGVLRRLPPRSWQRRGGVLHLADSARAVGAQHGSCFIIRLLAWKEVWRSL